MQRAPVSVDSSYAALFFLWDIVPFFAREELEDVGAPVDLDFGA